MLLEGKKFQSRNRREWRRRRPDFNWGIELRYPLSLSSILICISLCFHHFFILLSTVSTSEKYPLHTHVPYVYLTPPSNTIFSPPCLFPYDE